MPYLDDLAARLGVPYRFARMADGQRACLIAGTVLLDPDLTPERACWSYCHETAHWRLGHPDMPPRDETEEREQEAAANALAAELLLPAEQFRPLAGFSLAGLKHACPYASHEVLSRRRLAFRPGLLTIFDNEKLTARLAPDGWNCPRRLFGLEVEALNLCRKIHGDFVLRRDGRTVEATWVDEGRGVERVILFMEGDEEG